MNSKKATGIDNINTRLLKDASHIVVKPLAWIMNNSLRTGKIPLDWKKACFTAIFKSGDSEDSSDYRPISILPVCMKRAVHSKLYDYIQETTYYV